MLHALTIGLSAFLLFNLQPMIAKLILPLFGGGSSIWLTSLIFFQALLLAGYASVHSIVIKLNRTQQVVCFFIIIALALLFFPLQMRCTEFAIPPSSKILLLLLTSVGLPYFLLTCTSPLVQYFIGASQTSQYKNPYILYAVSNFGSMAGLLSYPLLIEPNMNNSQQVELWSAGFLAFVFLLSLCLLVYSKASGQQPKALIIESCNPRNVSYSLEITNAMKVKWFINAFIPCWALMVFTHYITVDIVNLPLLWVLPLCWHFICW